MKVDNLIVFLRLLGVKMETSASLKILGVPKILGTFEMFLRAKNRVLGGVKLKKLNWRAP